MNAILHHQGAVFVGGAFTQISGQAHRLLAAYNTNTTHTAEPRDESASPVRVFPNPASDRVMIASIRPLNSLELTDPLGRVLRTWQPLQDNQLELTLQDLPSGPYLLVWDLDGQTGHTRLQIQR